MNDFKADVTDVIVYIFASYDFETKRIHLTVIELWSVVHDESFSSTIWV